ncbi:hypothetical protein BH23BAC1_BH23BAC1_46290 [soil metagenome]
MKEFKSIYKIQNLKVFVVFFDLKDFFKGCSF